MANTYDISTYIQALETAKAAFAAASKGVDVRESIVNQCEAIIDIAEQIIADLNDAVDMSLAVPDTSLSQQGKPAEARATGVAISAKANKDYLVVEDRAAIGPDSVATLYAAAMGIGAEALSSIGQLAIGRYNVADSNQDYIFLVGNGNADNDRNNAAVIDTMGNAWFAGSVYVGGADLAHGSELATKAYADAIVQRFDSYPYDGSSNGVTSDGVYDATENAKSSVKNWVTSQEYATTSAMNTALSGKVNTSDVSNSISTDAARTTKVPSVKAIKDYVDAYTPTGIVDQTIEQNSQNAVAGGAVYTALGTKQNALTFDNAPAQNSDNPVKSGGIYAALQGKENTLTWDDTPTPNSANPVTSGGIYTALQNGASVSTGTFTPDSAFENASVTYGGVNQVGNVVYLSFLMDLGEAMPRRNFALGKITGVDAPSGIRVATALTTCGNQVATFNLAHLMFTQVNGETYVTLVTDGYETDTAVLINAYYFV